ncbi:cell surface A33 antigen [Paralichthys olivaceus]|uniref:cell surface A33 antigen n=1 Tax=Paralichthys olivaceus TaxID=8255 RepID=UPI00375227F6
MTTKKQVGWRKLFLILTVLPCCRSLEVSIPEREYMVASGSDVSLTCSFIPARTGYSTLVLSWEVDPENINDPMKSVATYFKNNPVDIAPAYEGRATLEVDLENHVSTLTLNKVTVKDSRRYQCSVLIPNDDEGTTTAATSLLVLVPPSPPVCSIHGKAEYWKDISLTCISEQGSPKPTYEWKSSSVENIPRVLPPRATQKDGVLSLFNISRETSGFFTCMSTNRVGTASCNITLAVTPGGMNMGSTAAIIGGVLAGLLVLGIVIFCYCRKKGKKEEYAEGAPGEVKFYDRDAPEAGEQYLDDELSIETKEHKQHEDMEAAPLNSYTVTVAHKFDDDQNSHSSGKERDGGKGSDINSKRYRDDQHDHYRGSRDRLDDKPNYHRGSRDGLDEQRDRSRGSRDRLDEQPPRSRGSRDRLDEQPPRSRGSRDRLDEHPDHYRGSRDRLDDERDNYRGSRDRLDDQRDNYRGSRDRLDYRDDQYRH